MINEKEVSYRASNTYSTLNDFTPTTSKVWVVFHGIGYLSRYFLRYFRHLDEKENYIIAPQAPARYYLDSKFDHVGASWATREQTETDIENALSYLDVLYEQEELSRVPNLVLFGYSQGVSILSRWVAKRKIQCSQLILHSGKIPKEIVPDDLDHLSTCKVSFVYGEEDPFIGPEFLSSEMNRVKKLFPGTVKFIPFHGGHQVNPKIISDLAKE